MQRFSVISLIVFMLAGGIAHPDPAAARRGGSGRAEAIWSPDGQWLAIVSFIPEKGGVWLYDAADFTAEPRLLIGFDPLAPEPHTIYDVAFSPDSQSIATAAPADGITLWDVNTFAAIQTFDISSATVAIGPDGTWIAVAVGGYVRIVNAATGDLLHEMINSGVWDVTFSPDGSILASSGCLDTAGLVCHGGGVWLWNAATGDLLDVLWGDFVGYVTEIAFSPDGSELAVSDEDGAVVRWNLAMHAQTELAESNLGGAYADGVAYNPDGSLFAYARREFKEGSEDSQIVIWDRAVDAEVMTLTQPVQCAGIAFSPDGSRLASGSISGGVHIWDVATGEVIAVLLAPEDATP